VTVPDPVPPFDVVRANVPGEVKLKVAVTDVSAAIVTVHVPVPVHPPPDQPANVEPASGVAVNVIVVPLS